MQKIKLFLVTSVLLFYSSCRQSKQANLNIKPSKQHVYAFHKYYPGLKPHHRISHDVFKRFRTLSIANYSLTQLFSLAVGEGTLFPEKDIVITSKRKDMLATKYCYQIIVDIKDADYLYTMMLASLHGQFPEYQVGIQYRGKERLLVIKDR